MWCGYSASCIECKIMHLDNDKNTFSSKIEMTKEVKAQCKSVNHSLSMSC